MEASEAATFAEQQAIAEMEKQKREWETARRLLERSPTPPEPETNNDDLLTFSREDSINQVPDSPVNPRLPSVNSSLSTKKNTKSRNPRCKTKPKSPVHSPTPQVNSDDESINDSNTDNANTSSSSDTEESSSSEEDSNYSSDSNVNIKPSKINSNESKPTSKSPRTRSHGSVKINLWTLDVNPLITSSKSANKTSHKKIKKNPINTDFKLRNSMKIRRKITNPNVNSENISQDCDKSADASILEHVQNMDDKENPLSNDDAWNNDLKKTFCDNHKDNSKSKVSDNTLPHKRNSRFKSPMKHVNITNKNKTLDGWLTNKVKASSNNTELITNQPVVTLTALPFPNPNLIIRTRRASCHTDREIPVPKKISKNSKIVHNKTGKTNESLNEI